MTLLELARRWLKPGAKAESEEAVAEEAAFRKRAAEVWLAYHENEAWAQRKLATGLNLTPEGLDYMERELAHRAAVKDHQTKIATALEAENVSNRNVPATPDDGRERPSDGERDGGGGRDSVPQAG